MRRCRRLCFATDALRSLRRQAQRADRPRVRRAPAVRGDRGALRRRDAPPALALLLPPGARGARPRDDDDPVPARRRRAGRGAGRRRPAGGLRRHRQPRRARARTGEARLGADQRARRPRPAGGRLLVRAVHAVVHQGADRGGRDDVRPAARRRALPGPRDGHRGLPGARAARGGGRRPDGPAPGRLRRVSLAADLRAASAGVWESQHAHPFVRGIGDGTLDEGRFRFYVRQDYRFLVDYGRLLALGAARAPRLAEMRRFAALAQAVLETEMALHVGFAERWGIAADELEAEPAAPATAAYTDFLLRTAALGDYAELVAALLPCVWGYAEIGERRVGKECRSRWSP